MRRTYLDGDTVHYRDQGERQLVVTPRMCARLGIVREIQVAGSAFSCRHTDPDVSPEWDTRPAEPQELEPHEVEALIRAYGRGKKAKHAKTP